MDIQVLAEQVGDEHDSPGTELNDPRLAQANKLFQTGVLLIFGKRKSVERAIKCIQKAITLNDTDYKYWQLLGEAYYQRGSLNPAINCFMKSLSLAEKYEATLNQADQARIPSDCTYSKLRMSDIRLSVAHLDEAMQGYSDIIKNDPQNVAALIGLAKAELQLARNCFSSNLVKNGHVHCMNALRYALISTKLRSNLCLTWKLASDCCIIQFVYGQRGEFRTILDVDFPGADQDGLLIDKYTCIDLAQQFLSKAIAIESFENSACLWHNLGLSLYLKSTLFKEETHIDELQSILKRSLKCLLKALDCDRTNSQIRNSIGIVAFKMNYLDTAQSYIIKSIRSNLSTSEIQFSNLGFIYLQKGEYRLANVAFNRCQAEEPLYARSWLGIALINEASNVDNLSLLRHCHKLESNYESQIMFATKVTSLKNSLEYKKDIEGALECMRNLINFDQKSPEALNTLGLLYEQCNFVEQARDCFDAALKISPQDSRIIFNRLRLHFAYDDCSVLNPGGVSNSNLEFITKAQKLASNGNNPDYILNFIYYLFNNRDYQSFNQFMTRLLDDLPQRDIRNKISAQILLALKARAGGEDFKSWLFKNIIDSENEFCIESVINLYCLLLIGSISEDNQLVEQISADLIGYLVSYISSRNKTYTSIFHSNDGYWAQLVMMTSIFCLKDTSKMIRPMVVLLPDVAEHWFYYALALMMADTHKQKTQYQLVINCLKKAKIIETMNANLAVICDILLAILVQEKKNTSANESRISFLCRATFSLPEHDLLRQALSSASGNKESPKKSIARREDHKSKKRTSNLLAGLDEQDLELFQLAISLTINMIGFSG